MNNPKPRIADIQIVEPLEVPEIVEQDRLDDHHGSDEEPEEHRHVVDEALLVLADESNDQRDEPTENKEQLRHGGKGKVECHIDNIGKTIFNVAWEWCEGLAQHLSKAPVISAREQDGRNRCDSEAQGVAQVRC